MRMLLPAAALALAACNPAPTTPQPAPTPARAEQSASPAPAATAASASSRATPGETVAKPSLAVEAEGLRWFLPPNGSARPLPFGTPRATVLASLERVRGPAGTGTNQDCGAGPVAYANWADGLSLVFQDGKLAGWGLDGRASGALATANGVGPGTTRGELAAAFGTVEFSQTSLGTEFAASGIYGVLDGPGPQARITDMWSGVSCVAR